jgi:hypothetical protein
MINPLDATTLPTDVSTNADCTPKLKRKPPTKTALSSQLHRLSEAQLRAVKAPCVLPDGGGLSFRCEFTRAEQFCRECVKGLLEQLPAKAAGARA